MVEIGEGELIFGSGKLDVTLLADLEQLAVVAVRAARGWGTTPPHVHVRHAEALYVFEGELALRLEDRVHRVGPESWAFVPPGVVHTAEVTGDTQARYLVLHTPGSGYGDYVRGDVAAFDQRPAADSVSADPALVVFRRAGGMEGDTITDRPDRRATVLVEANEITISEFLYGPGQRGAPLHVHREHADAFLVLDGEFTFHLRDGSHALPAGTLVVFPPGVVHGFDNDSGAFTRAFNFHMPSLGFADYMRGRNPTFDQFDPPDDGGLPATQAIVTGPGEGERLGSGNGVVVVKAALPDLRVAECAVDGTLEGAGAGDHHAEIDAYYVLEGELEVTAEGSVQAAGPGTLVSVPREARHAFARSVGGTARVLSLRA